MSEALDIGQHCCECRRVEFAPFTCSCGRVFCSTHRPVGACAHDAASTAAHAAPSAALAATATATAAAAASCTLCSAALPVATTCPLCRAVYCLPHRDPSAHACRADVRAQASSSRAAAPAAASLPASSSMRGAAAASAAAGAGESAQSAALRRKVALTKLRMRTAAPPGCPAADRLYLFVAARGAALAAEMAPAVAAALVADAGICISRRATVARLLDAVAAALGVRNDNSAQADATRRLHLAVVPRGAAGAPALLANDELLDAAGLVDGDAVVLTRGMPD